MSEWRGSDIHGMRTYAEGLYASAREATGWDLWGAPRPHDAAEIVATGPECLPFSRELCDAAAVAWVLIALARRLSAWAESIDAELARRYRAAVARTDAASEADEAAQTEASGAARKEAWIAQGRALDALVRGAL